MLSLNQQQTCYLMVFSPFPFKCLASLLSRNKTKRSKGKKPKVVLFCYSLLGSLVFTFVAMKSILFYILLESLHSKPSNSSS